MSTVPVAVLFVLTFTVPWLEVPSTLGVFASRCRPVGVSLQMVLTILCMGLRVADDWKIHHLLFPVPRGRWVCLHAE